MVCVFKIVNNIWWPDLQIRYKTWNLLILIRVCSILMINTRFWKGIAFTIFYNMILNKKVTICKTYCTSKTVALCTLLRNGFCDQGKVYILFYNTIPKMGVFTNWRPRVIKIFTEILHFEIFTNLGCYLLNDPSRVLPVAVGMVWTSWVRIAKWVLKLTRF